jgi:ABC-type Zn uptake system ZnuABC Zn-binding protein ZnuA
MKSVLKFLRLMAATPFVLSDPLIAQVIAQVSTPVKSICVLVPNQNLKLIVDELCQGLCVAKSIVPKAASDHDYQPSAKERMQLMGCPAVVRIGGTFDERLFRGIGLAGKSGKETVQIDLSRHLGFRTYRSKIQESHNHDHDHGHDHFGMDPHFWLDPVLTEQAVKLIAEQFAKNATVLWPSTSGVLDQIRKQSDQMSKDLLDIDRSLANTLKPWQNASIVVTHDAFNYLASRYGLSIEPVSIGGTGTRLQAFDLKEVLKKLKNKVSLNETPTSKPVILLSEVEDQLNKNVSVSLGARLVVIDVAARGPSATCTAWFRQLTENFKSQNLK